MVSRRFSIETNPLNVQQLDGGMSSWAVVSDLQGAAPVTLQNHTKLIIKNNQTAR